MKSLLLIGLVLLTGCVMTPPTEEQRERFFQLYHPQFTQPTYQPPNLSIQSPRQVICTNDANGYTYCR